MPVLLIALVALVVGSIGLFFGRMIKAGVSRQREFLADASAVQFTRPVSYTHLDVYKRQELPWSWRCGAWASTTRW